MADSTKKGEIKIEPDKVKTAGEDFKKKGGTVHDLGNKAREWSDDMQWGEGAAHDAILNRFTQITTAADGIKTGLETYGTNLDQTATTLEGVDCEVSTDYKTGGASSADDSFNEKDGASLVRGHRSSHSMTIYAENNGDETTVGAEHEESYHHVDGDGSTSTHDKTSVSASSSSTRTTASASHQSSMSSTRKH